jgi:hypothetical protein
MEAAGALDDAISKAGALQECRWESLPTWRHWNEEQSLLEDPDQESIAIAPEESAGILVSVKYEYVTYKAALLAGPDGYHDSKPEFTYLPLLATRLPNALRQTFVSFVSTNFDTHCSILRLPSNFLCAAFENYIAILNQVGARGNSSTSSRIVLESVVKESRLTLSFPPPIAPALKSLDVMLPRESLSVFFSHGSKMVIENSGPAKDRPLDPPPKRAMQSRGKKRKHPEGAVSEEQGPSNGLQDAGDHPSAPFLAALSAYFDTNLAMKLDLSDLQGTGNPENQHVRLAKVSCGAFILSSEGKVKFLANPGRVMPFDESDVDDEEDGIEEREKRFIWRANEGLLRALIRRAAGTRMQPLEENPTPTSG